MQKAAQIVAGRRYGSRGRTETSATSLRLTLRRDCLRLVSSSGRSDVAQAFDSIFSSRKSPKTIFSQLNRQFRAYSTEKKSSEEANDKKTEEKQREKDEKESEENADETVDKKKSLAEGMQEINEDWVNQVAGKDLPAWQYVVMISIIIAILVCIWRTHRYGSLVGDPPLSDFSISALKWFPTREGSRAWGWLTNLEVPVSLRKPIYGLYSRIFGVNLDEAEYPMEAYSSLAKFFTRNLKKGARWVDPEADMISPVDGKILHFGVMKQGGVIEQVKGIDYTLDQLIGADAASIVAEMRKGAVEDPAMTAARRDDIDRASFGPNGGSPQQKLSWGEVFMNWLPWLNTTRSKVDAVTPGYKTYYCVIYLAPGDYHAFHAPVDWRCTQMRHFPGDLFSVSPLAARWIKGLFALNERIVLNGYWRHGFMSYIPVGAYNVGSITLDIDEAINTNVRGDNFVYRQRNYKDLDINLGERLGWFNLGSTIVMVFDAPEFVFRVTRGQKVKLGQNLGNILTPELKDLIEFENEVRVLTATSKDEKAIAQIKDAIGFDQTAARVKARVEKEKAQYQQFKAEGEAASQK